MIRWPSLRSILLYLLAPSPSSPELRAVAFEYHRALVRAREAEARLKSKDASERQLASTINSVRTLLIQYLARTSFPEGQVSWERWSAVVDAALAALGYESSRWEEAAEALARAGVSTLELGDSRPPAARDTEPGPARVPATPEERRNVIDAAMRSILSSRPMSQDNLVTMLDAFLRDRGMDHSEEWEIDNAYDRVGVLLEPVGATFICTL